MVQIHAPLLRAKPSRLFVTAFRLSAVVPYGAAYPIGAMMSCEKQHPSPLWAESINLWLDSLKAAPPPQKNTIGTRAIWMKGDQAATVPREVGDHKRLVVFIADLQLSNPREATGVKFLNEAEAGHKSYVTIDFVPSSRSSAQKRSAVHHPAGIIGIMPQRVNVSASASSSA